jgi:hypothetical protein
MTLGNAAAGRVRLIVWCVGCRCQVEPATASLRAAEGGTSADPAEMARRYSPETPVADWHKRLVCSRCGMPYNCLSLSLFRRQFPIETFLGFL